MFAQTSLLFTVWRKDKLCTPLKINWHEKLQYKSYTTVEYFSSLRVYNVFESGWQSGNTTSLMPCWCLNSDVLMHVCSVKDHRWCQNVVRTKKWHTRCSQVCHWCFYNILMASVQTHDNMESICFIWLKKSKILLLIMAMSSVSILQ